MELDITVIGIGLIVLILLIDLIISGLKKKTKSTNIDVITGEKIGKKKGTNIFSYIINRKRNIVSVILVTVILKVLIHFFVFPEMVSFPIPHRITRVMRPATIGYHVERTLTTRQDLFAYSFGGLLVVVFLFNDKIKAR
jgi:hypothetical protein